MPCRWPSQAAAPRLQPCRNRQKTHNSDPLRNSGPRAVQERRNAMNARTRVKERAEEQSSTMNADQQAVIRMVANDLHRLNQSVMKAVETGVSVELVRSARH